MAGALCTLGCPGKNAASPPKLEIGAVLPLTGDNAKYGATAKDAIDLVIAMSNAKGGIEGRAVQVDYEDSQGTNKGAVSATQKLISVNKVPVIIGDLLSSGTLAMAPIAESNRVVVLSPTSSTPKLTEAGEYIFRNCASDTYEGTVMADYSVKSLGVKTAAVLYDNNAYGVGIANVFGPRFVANGGKIVLKAAFPEGATDFRTALTQVKAANPDAVYIVGYKELGQLLRQARELGVKSRFLSTVLFEDPEIIRVAGKASDGVIYSARGFDVANKDQVTKEFVRAYRDKYGSDPDIFAAYSYDAARILMSVMKDSGTSSDSIKDGLLKVRDFPAVTGSTTFDQNGDVSQAATIKMVKDGKFVALDPKKNN